MEEIMILIYPLVAVVVLTQASLEEHTGCTICDVDVYCRSDGYCCNNTIDNIHENVPRSTCVPTRLIANKSETRYFLPISSPGIQKLDFISKVMMVTRCLSNVDNTTLQDLCENAEVYNTVESLLPVTDFLVNYRNKYCAYCNWITDDVLTDWTLELYCDVDLSFTKQIVDAVKRRMCNVFFNPPENIAVSECYIDTRNDTNPGCITTVQGTFISDNDTYDRLCFPGQDRSFDVISQHQYMCYSCEADHGPLIGEFDVGCVLRNFDIIDDLSPPFTAILDPNVLHSMADDANTDQVTCDPATQFEDLRMRQCREIYCHIGRYLSDDHQCVLGNTEWAEANEHGCYNRAIVIRLTPDSSKGGLEEAILNENLFQDRLRMFFLSFMPQQLISYHQLYRKSSRLTGSVEYLVAVFVIDTEPLVMDMILHMYTQVHNSYFEPIRGVSLLTELVTYDLPLDSTSSSRNISVLSPDNMVTDYLEIVPIAYNGYNHSNGNSCIWQFFKLEVCPFVKIHLTELSAQIDNGFLYIESNTSTVIFNMFEYTIEFDTISLCVRDYSKVSVILDTGFGQSASTGSSNVVPVKQLLAFWCVCLSLLCLLITLVVYIALPQLQSQPGMNNIVLCISLLMAQSVYQFGAAQTSLPNWACELIGAVCHFLWLCVVFSMNVCSAEMFFVFRKLTRLPPRFSWAHTMRNITYIFLCSISFVLVNCVVSLSLSNGNSRGYGGSICYLSSYIMHLVTFVLPVVATVSSNIVFFSVVVLKLYKLAADSVNLQQERNYLTIYARLSTLTGLTWVFGFLQILLHNDVLEYLFIILNASQGIFIMIAFIFNKRTLVLCIKGINPQNNPQSLQDHKSKSNDIQHISITNHKTFK